MSSFVSRGRPSPAMAVAFVALLIALSGTAIALPGKNVVDSGDIKRGAVKAADIGRNAVNSGKVRNNSLRGGDVRNNSLTGGDINEDSLGQVPSANTANSATTANSANTAASADTADSVGGVRFRSFRFAATDPIPSTEVLNFEGLVLSATCVGANLQFNATTTVDHAQLDSYSVEPDVTPPAPNQNEAFDGDFNVGDPAVNLVPNDEDNEVGALRYTKLDGSGVYVQWHTYDQDVVDCGVSGVASAF